MPYCVGTTPSPSWRFVCPALAHRWSDWSRRVQGYDIEPAGRLRGVTLPVAGWRRRWLSLVNADAKNMTAPSDLSVRPMSRGLSGLIARLLVRWASRSTSVRRCALP